VRVGLDVRINISHANLSAFELVVCSLTQAYLDKLPVALVRRSLFVR
jgi:hypothetical protein